MAQTVFFKNKLKAGSSNAAAQAEAQTAINLSYIYSGDPEILNAAGPIAVTRRTTIIDVGGALVPFTLADAAGNRGRRKSISFRNAIGTGVITPTSASFFTATSLAQWASIELEWFDQTGVPRWEVVSIGNMLLV